MCVENNLPLPELEYNDIEFDFGMLDALPYEEIAVGRINHDLMRAREKLRRIIRNFFN